MQALDATINISRFVSISWLMSPNTKSFSETLPRLVYSTASSNCRYHKAPLTVDLYKLIWFFSIEKLCHRIGALQSRIPRPTDVRSNRVPDRYNCKQLLLASSYKSPANQKGYRGRIRPQMSNRIEWLHVDQCKTVTVFSLEPRNARSRSHKIWALAGKDGNFRAKKHAAKKHGWNPMNCVWYRADHHYILNHMSPWCKASKRNSHDRDHKHANSYIYIYIYICS
jgi:hypothetical protein